MFTRARRVTAGLLLAAGVMAVPAQTTYAAVTPGDGLALTPPMGFNNWNSTHCRADFNEAMVKGIADIFVDRGLKDAGYQYVNLDDCWALPQRNTAGDLVADPVRFPNGIKAVADYVHAKGLKFGIYTSAGTKTCNTAGFPGGLGFEQQDANLFASFGVDYLKYDNCNNQGVDAKLRYTTMRDALRRTGRPIVFSLCEWGQNRPWEWAADVGHLWRTTGDISDSYTSMLSIAKTNWALADHAGPGHWNDPDMLEVGNGGMTDTEYRSHFGLWSIMAAPLLIGADLRKVSPATFDILGNREIIAVDQDPLGVQGRVIRSVGGVHVLVKPLQNGDRAVLLFNEGETTGQISTSAAEIGLQRAPAYRLRDLWTHTDRHTAGSISATLPPHGSAMFRVSMDRNWAQYPPAVSAGASIETVYPGALPIVKPGRTATVTTSITNTGRAPALFASSALTAPAGWTVQADSPTSAEVLRTDQSLSTKWTVGVPATLGPGKYVLSGQATYRPDVTLPYSLEVVIPGAPPSGSGFVSDINWLRVTNGYGPVEKDRSNGESRAGDGRVITINGVTYAKGLGTHAPGVVEYYVAGQCTSVTADVGLDDEKGNNGTATFEVWADGRKVADSGVLTNLMPAKPLRADITGATLVRLISTDAGDGNNSDHTDWADARITCS
ncbi:alpha-galactosidase [Kibdelosporangium banguiense]|uniref:Alpha-galactosidase n=1 Tax=Kibdelosporangium banguiense TaxID=1365924 RepID=A0ABS4TJP0_9PSEU|nr:NPCBM/NEW2 domain-containing protein [Kibdelosporangium banguiense]MBP2324234.1 alpha-galactosidase [Kibdelosporangium banguiense]